MPSCAVASVPRAASESFRGLFREVLGVPTEELLGVVGKEVDLLADASGFAGLQAADPRVAVEADVDAFEEFEGAVAGDGEQGGTIGRDGPDDPVGDAIQGDRALLTKTLGEGATAG